MKKHHLLIAALAVGGFLAFPDLALAAGADWEKPVEDGVKSLTKSLITIGGAAVGLSLVGYPGRWRQGTNESQRLGSRLLAGGS